MPRFCRALPDKKAAPASYAHVSCLKRLLAASVCTLGLLLGLIPGVFAATVSVFLFETKAFAADVATPALRPRMGIVMPSFRESRWQYDIQALQDQADQLEVDIIVRFAGNDQDQQNIQIKELVNLGINILIIAPADVANAAEGVNAAKKQGIPVVSYDRLAENCDIDAYVAFERLRVGELMGEFLAKNAPKGNYIIIHGPKSDSNAREFSAGAMKYLTPLIQSGDIRVVEEQEATAWHADVAKQITKKALLKTTDIIAVLAPNDDTAGGVIEALADYNLAGKVFVTGQDANTAALHRINEGTQSMTVFKNSTLLARKAMQVALALHEKKASPTDAVINNGKLDVPTYFIPVSFVNKESLRWLLRTTETD